MLADSNRIKVYNEGVLIAKQSDDGMFIELLESVDDKLIPRDLFGPKGRRRTKVPTYTWFIPFYLANRLLPEDRVGLREYLDMHDVVSREEFGLKYNYAMWDDNVTVEMPRCDI